jgi:ElaB/YqjD/DUF883 family membrane-anchored ribosome-binding protein
MDPTTGRLDSRGTIDATDGDEESIEIDATRAQIEQTRAEMSGTIDAIKDRLSPQNLVQQAKETVKEATVGKAHQVAENVVEGAKRAANTAVEGAERAMNSASDTAREAGSSFVETVQRNPIPSAMIGLGLGWLWMNMRKQEAGSSHYGRPYWRNDSSRYGTGYDYSGYQSSAAGTTYGREAEQSRVGEIASQVQQKAGDMTEQVQQKASHLGHQAQAQAHRAAAGFEHILEEHPLAMGAVALTLGAAIGMAIPETRQENRMMGEARDRVVEKAQQASQEVAQKVQSVAQEAIGTAKETAKDEARAQGLTG